MGSRRPISAILAVFGGLEIGLRCAGYAGWVCIRCSYMIWGVRRAIRCHLKNPFSGIFEAKDLLSRVFEFGMTQAFSGQTDGTSRSGMARKP